MLAHELRNPLAPISHAVQILALIKSKEPLLDNARAMIERQVTHLVRLVDDLLDVSRVSRGKIQLHKIPLDLSSVARQAIETSQPLIDSRRHHLTVTLPQDALCVDGDFVRLAQVVTNLLNNAAKYTDEGGQIWLTVEQTSPGEAVVRVRDNGRGIDPSALSILFNLFYQVDRNLDRAEGGLGIGLSLVKSLVEMHGGRVEARSAGRGTGSEFSVHLPLLREILPAAPTKAATSSPAVHPTRILMVDDNRDAAETLALLLRMDGHEVWTAHDGKKAVELALRERPAVVVMDIGLPGLDGYQACRVVREEGLTDALMIAITGYGQEEDRRLSRESGFDAHLVKPVDLMAIRQLLAERGRRAT
jgi:CheY-like chemotaxis protein